MVNVQGFFCGCFCVNFGFGLTWQSKGRAGSRRFLKLVVFLGSSTSLNSCERRAPYFYVIGDGEEGAGSGDYFLVTNNILLNNINYGFKENGITGVHNIYKNNLIYNSGAGDYWLYPNTPLPQGNLHVDTGFVNFQADGLTGNYHLLPSSPALNSGAADGAPQSDYDGIIHQCNSPNRGGLIS